MLILFIVCVGIGLAGYAAICGDRLGCIAAVALGAIWLWADKPVEGRILVTLTRTHGITLADLFSVACFAMAGFGWIRGSRRRAQERAGQAAEQVRISRAGRHVAGPSARPAATPVPPAPRTPSAPIGQRRD